MFTVFKLSLRLSQSQIRAANAVDSEPSSVHHSCCRFTASWCGKAGSSEAEKFPCWWWYLEKKKDRTVSAGLLQQVAAWRLLSRCYHRECELCAQFCRNVAIWNLHSCLHLLVCADNGSCYCFRKEHETVSLAFKAHFCWNFSVWKVPTYPRGQENLSLWVSNQLISNDKEN